MFSQGTTAIVNVLIRICLWVLPVELYYCRSALTDGASVLIYTFCDNVRSHPVEAGLGADRNIVVLVVCLLSGPIKQVLHGLQASRDLELLCSHICDCTFALLV